ncbi:MAG TPA: PEGA domain-containing protein [Polyangiales bacterium]|nr:PEGA domain-containing protein [Polyangiales bacterium]
MIDLEAQYRRWAELMDRDSAGESLSPDELDFCERFVAQHPACAREQELLLELADLDAAPSPESRALVDATLARLADEAAQAERVELSRLRGRGRVPRTWLLTGGAVAAAALALMMAWPRKHDAPNVAIPVASPLPAARVELVYASGDVRVNGVRLPTGSAVLLAEGSRVSVGEGGGACLAMDPEIDVCARADSELVLSRTGGPWRRLDLLRGKVGVQLATQPAGYHFSVVVADVWSTAVGTAFTVANEGERGVRTTVMHGKVRVGRDGANEQLIGAHERAEVESMRASVTAVGRGDESSEWALLRPAALWQDRVSATLVLHGEPVGAEVVLDDQPIGIAPLATLVPAGKHRLQVRVQGRSVLDRELLSEAGQTAVISYDAAALAHEAPAAAPQAALEPALRRGHPRSRAAARSAEANQPEPAADMLREAHRLMRAQSFDQAAKQYDALRTAYPESPEATTVLVSLAELQLDRLRRPALALDNLERYLADGSGGLGEEARQVRIRALRALGEREREGIAIEEFLRLHPRSFKAPALQRRLAELQAAR